MPCDNELQNFDNEVTSDADEEFEIPDYHDHPYSSPSRDSENDDRMCEFDFSEFTMGSEDCVSAYSVAGHSNSEVELPRTSLPLPGDDWCFCGNCSNCPQREAVCCNSMSELNEFIQSGQCITDESFFKLQLLSEEGLQYNRIMFASSILCNEERRKYLDRAFDNGMKRHLCYRNFVLFINRGQPIGRGNRLVLPRCVIERIRQEYPDPDGQYRGFDNGVNQ